MDTPHPVREHASPRAHAAAAPAHGEVVELRQYTLHPGRRDALVELFDREFVETQEAAGMRVMGQFRDLDDADRFVWLRGLLPALAPWLARPVQTLRLAPTARSALHA